MLRWSKNVFERGIFVYQGVVDVIVNTYCLADNVLICNVIYL